MSWHRVVITHRASAVPLTGGFVKAYDAALPSGEPADVSVHHRKISTDEHVYLISPAASNLAPEVLREFKATACAEEPDLSGFTKLPI